MLKALLILAVVITPFELLLRTPQIQAALFPPITTVFPTVGIKQYLLEQYVKQEGRLDCLIVGSSMPDRGIDPERLSAGYEQRTGKAIKCFNFAIIGFDDFDTAAILEIIVRDYHPRLLIYGTSARDFGHTPHYTEGIPWAQYQSGRPSFEGWLESSFMSYRYYLTYSSYLTDVGTEETMRSLDHLSRYGQFQLRHTAAVDGSPERSVRADLIRSFAKLDPRTTDMSGLERLLRLKEKGVEIVLVEMPMPAVTINFLPQATRITAPIWIGCTATATPPERRYSRLMG